MIKEVPPVILVAEGSDGFETPRNIVRSQQKKVRGSGNHGLILKARDAKNSFKSGGTWDQSEGVSNAAAAFKGNRIGKDNSTKNVDVQAATLPLTPAEKEANIIRVGEYYSNF